MVFDQSKYIAEYDRKNSERVYIKLNKRNDADVLDKLKSVENRQGYIKRLIREDIAREGKENDSSGQEE